MDLKRKLTIGLSAQTIEQLSLVQPCCPRTKFSYGDKTLSYGMSPSGYDVRLDQEITLEPGDVALGSTIEKFNLPNFVRGFCCNKSTHARQWLDVSIPDLEIARTLLEPGWHGFLTIEMKNFGKELIHLPFGVPIAQIIFELLDKPTNQPYEKTAKYQNQPAHPVGPR